MRRPSVAFGLAAGLYFLLSLVLTWPLALHMGSRIPNDLGDSLLNMFLLAWNTRQTPLTAEWWNLPQFHPIPGATAFSEHLLGLSVITSPIIAVTGNTLLAYNTAFFLSFPLCALASHLLAFELTRRHDTALVAGLAYGFSPYRMSQLAHIQVLSAYWIPLSLLGLHLFLRTRRWWWAALFAVSWLMQALACGYYIFYFSVLMLLWLLWFAVGRVRWIELGTVLLAWGAAALLLVPVALGYLKHQTAYGLRRWPDEIEAFSADTASVLAAPGNLRLWGWLNVIQRPESDFFPGLALVVLITTGAAVAWSAAARAEMARLWSLRMLLSLAMVFAFVAATPLWFGAWKLEILGVTLLSVGTSRKPLSIAILLAAVALAMHPSIRFGWRQRSPLAFYTISAVVMWLFTLGPSPTFMDKPFLYKAPYSWLMMVPGVEGIRVPARFWVLATVCLATAAGLALHRVIARWGRAQRFLPGAVAAIMLLESWPQPIVLEPEPAARPARTRAIARLELPLSPGRDLEVLYRAIEHRRPVLNGYSGYFAPHYLALEHLLERRDPAVLTYLRSIASLEVVVDHDSDPRGRWRAYIASQPFAELVHDDDAYTSYRLGRLPSTGDMPVFTGQPLAVAGIQASAHPDRVGYMTDGDRITRWDTGGPQGRRNVVVVDLGAVQRVEGIELQIAGFVADFPRQLVIEASEDGTSWQPRWKGPTALVALQAAIEAPLTVPLRFPLGGLPARYVRLRQTSADPIYYWSIAELRVYGG
jgi:hypothetical protein